MFARPAARSHSAIVWAADSSAAFVHAQPLGVRDSTDERASVGCCVRSTYPRWTSSSTS